ncbi:uncharacterized protein TM35_000063510, partial [Trypanosoma theileri]
QPKEHPSVDTIPLESDKQPKEHPSVDKVTDKDDSKRSATILQRWQEYIQDGCIEHFDGSIDVIEIVRYLGTGGSSLVYEGRYGSQQLPVAVKCFIIPDGMEYKDYVRESLTNIAFFVFFNQLEECGIIRGTCVYDFLISDIPPKGMPEKDVRLCTRQDKNNNNIANGNDNHHNSIKLCYLVTTLMDGVIGRFLKEGEEDYDPCYDTLINSPLRDGEIFQFLYTQLVLRALFDYTVLDMMLNGQLRGDNLGYTSLIHNNNNNNNLSPSRAVLPTYKGIVIVYQLDHHTSPLYLRFPADISDSTKLGPLRFICFIDLGQGKQPQLQELTQRGLIGETIVESCIQDDGLGRYWPSDRIYSKYIDTHGTVAKAAVEWGAGLCIDSPQSAEKALRELFELYAPTYGVENLSEEELVDYVVLTWTPTNVERLQREYIYRASTGSDGVCGCEEGLTVNSNSDKGENE